MSIVQIVQNKKYMLWAVLVSVSVFCVVLVFAMFYHLKRVETDFGNKKAILIKDNMDLKDKIYSLNAEILKKAKQLTLAEEEKAKIKAAYDNDVSSLRDENNTLKQEVAELEGKPIVEQIREAAHKEQNENLKKFLEKTLYSIILIKSGKNIELEPIVVENAGGNENEEQSAEGVFEEGVQAAETAPLISKGKEGKVLSVDKKYSLIVIDIGRSDGVKENQSCLILRGGKNMASAKIISVRYKVSAAFVDEMSYGYNIRDLKEDDDALVLDDNAG